MGRANARNRNGRVYPKPLLQRQAAAFYDRHVRNRRALGELDHPAPTSPTFRCLDVSNVSHQVLDYFWKDNDLMGYVEVLPTRAGGMLRDLYAAGFQLGMSSRGWATLKDEDGFIVIQEDFELITFDFVSDPSTEGAYLRPLQRRYDTLRPPIDIHETYDEFMRHTAAGQAHLKKLARGEAELKARVEAVTGLSAAAQVLASGGTPVSDDSLPLSEAGVVSGGGLALSVPLTDGGATLAALGVPNGFVFLEVDENQHKYGYGDHLSCDMKRMASVMESLAVETNYNLPCLYWLRYNPNAWRVGSALRTVPKVEREARLVAWLERFACDKDAPFGIGYAFYDCEAEDEDGDPGMLDVLGNEEYNKEYAKAVDNLMGLDVGETGDAE